MPIKKLTQMGISHFFLHHRGELCSGRKENLPKITQLTVIYTSRKLKTCLPSLNSSFDQHPKSHVIYEIICSECDFTKLGQFAEQITTRMVEHQRKGFNGI